MEEPVHRRESQFWDLVADWVLRARALGRAGPMTEAETEEFIRNSEDGPACSS